jgi:outer membrane receptor protein involved in Fe transport
MSCLNLSNKKDNHLTGIKDMTTPCNLKPKLILLAILTAYAMPQMAMAADKAETLKLKKIDVISTTPLQGVGLTLDKIPASVQLVKGEDIKNQQSLTIADFMTQNLLGVSVNDTQNNPFQPDIVFRGFTASPLLGTPQGLSVFVDGVRVNEPFGDVVNWDLIPANAIAGVALIPGSNPVFGLNTLGGALSVQTKSGRTHQGGSIEALGGSWGRKAVSGEYGGVSKDGSVDYFFSGTSFRENGWRNASETDVRQVFGKIGWQNETSKMDLSYTGADNDMIGNGMIQGELMQSLGRKAINTSPDQTKNTMSFLNFNGSHWINDDTMLSANAYYRQSNRKTLNGDINDDYDSGTITHAAANALCLLGDSQSDELCNGALNRSNTKQKSYGMTAQLAFNQDLATKKNQLIVGAGYDQSKIKFSQTAEFGSLNAMRSVDGFGVAGSETQLHGTTDTWSLFATDTLSLNEFWHATLSGRYNHVKVDNKDQLIPIPDPIEADNKSLTSMHTFSRFNPAVGLNFTPNKDLTVYGSYNEGTRAPTSMELGCANPAQPCKLPNAMAGDPPLKQVVAKTFEAGMRGNLSENIRWSFATYRTENHDDIQFLNVGNALAANQAGYFDNVGKTRRVGLDSSLSGNINDFSWMVGYSFVNATYQNQFDLTNEVNSTSNGDVITVHKGDRLANIPQHQVKLRMQYEVTANWSVGSNITMFSDRYMRGNENNAHTANTGDPLFYQGSGKVAGYTVVNLDTKYNLGKGWSVFGKATNILDQEYSNGGMMGHSLLDPSNGSFTGQPTTTGYYMPGAPRAGWIGVRFDFDKPKSTAN